VCFQNATIHREVVDHLIHPPSVASCFSSTTSLPISYLILFLSPFPCRAASAPPEASYALTPYRYSQIAQSPLKRRYKSCNPTMADDLAVEDPTIIQGMSTCTAPIAAHCFEPILLPDSFYKSSYARDSLAFHHLRLANPIIILTSTRRRHIHDR
jgi:hypothetical protein